MKLNWFENLNPVIQALIATTFTWGVTALRCIDCLLFQRSKQKSIKYNIRF